MPRKRYTPGHGLGERYVEWTQELRRSGAAGVHERKRNRRKDKREAIDRSRRED